MGKNKQQLATEARTKKSQPAEPVAEQPKPAPAPATPAATQPAVVSKQTETVERLKAGWKAKGVNLDKLTVKDDGKFKQLIVDAGWPTVQVGASGGITVVELKSYPDAFTGAMEGLERYTKQQAREQKRATATAPAPQAPATQPAAKETTTAKKAKADAAIEQQLQTA